MNVRVTSVLVARIHARRCKMSLRASAWLFSWQPFVSISRYIFFQCICQNARFKIIIAYKKRSGAFRSQCLLRHEHGKGFGSATTGALHDAHACLQNQDHCGKLRRFDISDFSEIIQICVLNVNEIGRASCRERV